MVTLGTLRKINRRALADDADNASDIAVENVLLIIITNLHHLVANAQNIAGNIQLCLVRRRWIEIFLQKLIQILHAAGILMHRRKHLHAAPVAIHRQLRITSRHKISCLILIGKFHQRKLALLARSKLRHLAAVNLMRIEHNRTDLRLTENIFQTHNRHPS